MTYCCGILVRDGLVMIADTRTNAGLDNVSTFRKLHIFSKPGERIMAVASAGNLAISQSVLSTLTEGMEDPHTGEVETLMNAPTMFQAAQRIGKAIRAVHATEGTALKSEDINFDVSFLFGGQIKGARMRLFMVYPAGNFIECTTDTPYLQIGEHKYGKPVLDRAMHYDVELYGALKTEARTNYRWTRPCAPVSASACRSTRWWYARTSATPTSITVSKPANRITTICARAGRRRCARRIRTFRVRPTRTTITPKP